MFEQFQGWYEKRHDYAREWKKRTGGKVMGYLCTYVPEEILYAANVLPVRIMGSHEPQSVTEPHIFGMFCPFCRDCLAQGLLGRYDYLDGLMISQSCLHIRQTFSSWKSHRPPEFSYYLAMPNALQGKAAVPFFKEELVRFTDAVEKWVGTKLGDEDFDRGIAEVNGNRQLMKQAYALRKADHPPLTGLEAMYMVVSSQVVEKAEHSAVLDAALKNDALHARLEARDPGVRLMIVGSEDDDTKFLQMVESAGATIVCDDHCTGSRYFWDEIHEESDRILAIAKRYVSRTPCPSKDWPGRSRFERILDFAKAYQVQGAIVMQQKFCDPHECDKPALTKILEENGIKTLFLEFDVTVPVGQFRIRVDAFLETFTQDELFGLI